MTDQPSLSEIARRLAAQRKRVPVVCAICSKEFEATTRRRYCSRACNQKAVRRRAKKRAEVPPREGASKP